jgi:hypothetical protein
MRHALEKALGHKPCAIHLSKDCCVPKVKFIFSDIVILEEAENSVFKHIIYFPVLLSAHCFARKYFWIVDSKQLSVFYVMTAY